MSTPSLEPWLNNDFHFSMPNTAPVTYPINHAAKFSPPKLSVKVDNPPVARPLPHGTFFNSANPGRVSFGKNRTYIP